MHRSLSEYILTTPLQNFHRRQEIHRAVREYFSTEEEVQILLKNIRKTPQGYEWKVNAKAIRENLSSLLDWNIPDIRSPYQAEILFIKAEHSDYLPEKITEATRYYFPKAPAKDNSGSNSPDTRRPASSAGPHSIRLFPRSLMFHLRFYSQRNPLEK